MKKIILVAVAILAFGSANAQAKFGVKAGLNLADLSESGSGSGTDFKSYIGFHIGGFAEFKLSDKIALQPELLYSTQGAKFDMYSADLDANGNFTFKLAYINIPVMFKYYASEKFSLEAGPQIGFLTSAKGKVEIYGNSAEEDVKDFFNSTDFAFNLGAGYDFTNKISVNVRYSLGLGNIADTESGDDYKLKNNVLLVSLGYKFN